MGHGGSPEEALKDRQTFGDVGTEDLQEEMVFRLEPFEVQGENKDDPMWSMDPVGLMDWFYESE